MLTALKRVYPEINAIVYNLEVTSGEVLRRDIVQYISEYGQGHVLVCMTLTAGNVPQCMRWAQELRDLGCHIFIGGPEVTAVTAPFYAKHPFINGCVVGGGENILPIIVEQGFGVGENIFTKEHSPNTTIWHPFDFVNAGVDYNLLYALSSHKGISALFAGDCALTATGQRCVFCGRATMGHSSRPDPKVFWDELETAHAAGVDIIYNTADTVGVYPREFNELATAVPTWRQQVLAEKPEPERWMKAFMNATQLTDEFCYCAKAVGARFAIGVESLTDIQIAGKGNTQIGHIERAFQRASRFGVPLIATSIAGLPGTGSESWEADTEAMLNFYTSYAADGTLVWVTHSPLLIILGSRLFLQVLEKMGLSAQDPTYWPRESRWEAYNPIRMTAYYYDQFCGGSYEEAVQSVCGFLEKAKGVFGNRITLDSKGMDPDLWLLYGESLRSSV